MAVSGTVSTTKFNVRKVVDHAFRRVRIPAQQITAELQDIARSNLYLLLSGLVNRGEQLWTNDSITVTMVAGQGDYILADGTVDVAQVNFKYVDGREVSLSRLSQDSYMNLPNKSFAGRPVEFWLDRQRDAPVLRLWPVPDAAAALNSLVVWRSRHIMDVGELTDDLDIPQRWTEAIISQLAWRVAMEAPEVEPSLVGELKLLADEQLLAAQNAERDSSPMRLQPNIRVYTR